MAVVLDFEVEATLHAPVCLHAVTQFFGVASGELCHCHCRHGVLYIDGDGLSQLYAFYCFYGRNEVECYLAVVYFHVVGMEVAFVAAVFVHFHTLLHILFHFQVAVYDECSAGLYECGVVPEAFEIGFFCAVDVEVVGVGGGDYCHPRAQPVERTVELVGFYDDVVALAGEYVVASVVLGDASEERVAVDVALVHDVCAHGGCGCLAVCSCHAESLVCACECSEHLRALLYREPAFAEECEFLVFGGYCRGVDYEA